MKKSMQNSQVVPYYDDQRRTCIQVERKNGAVKFIPLVVSGGLKIQKLPELEFDRRYQPMVNYPAEKACQLYLGYSQNIGASREVLEYLGRIVNVSKQEFEMAAKKQQVADEKKVAPRRITEASPRKIATPKISKMESNPYEEPGPKPTKTRAAKPMKAVEPEPASKPASKPGERKPSAAQMFQDLIMAGKLTDDQIFEKVQAEFGLDEKKRGYVKWYRSHLRKQGKNPPDAKESK